MRNLVLASILTVSSIAHAQSARDAVVAFSKLQAKTEVGVSLSDYSSALGDANYQFKAFTEGPEAQQFPTVKEHLFAALSRYTEAAILWQSAIESGAGAIYPKAAIKIVADRYPQVTRREDDGGAAIGSGGLRASLVLPLYWHDAAQSIQAAKSAIPNRK